MSNSIQQLMEQIDNRILRERVLIFLTILAVIFFIWNFLLQARFDDEAKAIELETLEIESERHTLESRIAELTMTMASDPALVRQNEITQLNKRIDEVEARLSGLSQGLIGAALLPKALEDVLQKTTAITVLQVRTAPATELRLATKAPETVASVNVPVEEGGTGVYKHSVLIRVSGNYAQLLQLLTEIESLPWRFYWESLDYEVNHYPNAIIDIHVFTLSSEEGQFGV